MQKTFTFVVENSMFIKKHAGIYICSDSDLTLDKLFSSVCKAKALWLVSNDEII